MLKRLLLFAILLISCDVSFSQLRIPAEPYAFISKLKAAKYIPAKNLQPINSQALKLRDSVEGISNRFGELQTINLSLKNDSNLEEVIDDGKIWRVRINCDGAKSLGIHFDRFFVPDGALLFVYNSEHKNYYGAFSSQNNKSAGNLSIAEFIGNEIIIEYFEPNNAAFEGELLIGSISTAYKDFTESAASNQDVVCPKWASWRMQSHSVARMTFVSNRQTFYCTGSLINNVRNDGTPYFLTANHCIKSNTSAGTLIAYFNYEAEVCGQKATNLSQTLSGAQLRATSVNTDFTLLEFDENPPASYLPYFSGWDATGNNPGLGTCIHHPGGSQKIAITSSKQPTTYNKSISWDNGAYTPANTHWRAEFSNTNISTGSSGGPLFDDQYRIIGQLHGGDDIANFFGKLSISWDIGNLGSARLDNWLDPDKTGTLILDGNDSFLAPEPEFTATPLSACIQAPVLFTDLSKFKPTQWEWTIAPQSYIFTGGTDASSQNPQIEFLDSAKYSISLKTTNSNGSVTNTKQDYIAVKNTINVSFSDYYTNSSVCGYELENKPVIAAGATSYTFNISPTERIDTVVNANELVMSLNKSTLLQGSFYANIEVVGRHGNCKSSDKLNLYVNIPINDQIGNAIMLGLGANGPFSNNCATIDANEPQPSVLGCELEKSWCYDTLGGSAVQNSLWFKFVGPSNGLATFDATGFDSQVSIYESASAEKLFSGLSSEYQIIAANDNRSGMAKTSLLKDVELTPGKTYFVQLDGFKGDTGSINIIIYNNNIEVYPNPSTGKFTAIISNSANTPCVLEVYSPLGQLALRKNVNVDQQNNSFDFDFSNEASGIYSIVARLNGNVFTKKILIVRGSPLIPPN